MKYAKFMPLGGELIDADSKYAEYSNYCKGFKCPVCPENVHLRKGFDRVGKPVRAAFVHHKGVEGFSDCELRVKNYSLEDVQRVASESRGQRLEKFKRGIWKYLETTAIVNMNQWSKMVEEVKRNPANSDLVKNAEKILHLQNELACQGVDKFFRLFEENPNSVIKKFQKEAVKTFLRQRKRDWPFHLRIMKEALELFTKSPHFSDLRNRFACFVCHPEILKLDSQLWHISPNPKEWQKDFSKHIGTRLIMIFLTVDWIKLLNSDIEDFNNSQSPEEFNNSQSREKRSKKIPRTIRVTDGIKRTHWYLEDL